MAGIKYVTCKDGKALELLQDKVFATIHKARTAVQVALVATILHIAKHGDYTSANRMVEGLGNTVNGKAVVEFFVRYGALVIGEDGKSFGGLKKDFTGLIAGSLDEAKATMWYDLKIQAPFKGFSLEAALMAVIKQHKAAIAKAGDDNPELVSVEVNDSTIRSVLALCNFDAIIRGDGANDDVQDGDEAFVKAA